MQEHHKFKAGYMWHGGLSQPGLRNSLKIKKKKRPVQEVVENSLIVFKYSIVPVFSNKCALVMKSRSGNIFRYVSYL